MIGSYDRYIDMIEYKPYPLLIIYVHASDCTISIYQSFMFPGSFQKGYRWD